MNAVKLRTTVGKDGRVRLPRLPLRRGARVEIIILEAEAGQDDLLKAAETSLSFWDNRIDDEAWNDA